MLTRLHASTLRRPSLPLWLLGALVVVSLAARLAWIAEPCRSPCTTPNDHLLIFDEDYYVNAARVIVGIHPPHGDPYWNSPLGTDPNSEHPQLVKLLIAGGIELFGDGPFAWRLPSVLLGAVAILGMYALVRAAGGGRWLGLGAAALMASDNLLLVHGTDRHARRPGGGGDDLGGGAVRAQASVMGRRRARDRRVRQGGDAVSAVRALVPRAVRVVTNANRRAQTGASARAVHGLDGSQRS